MKKQKENSREGITWSEMGKQNVQAEKGYCLTVKFPNWARFQPFLVESVHRFLEISVDTLQFFKPSSHFVEKTNYKLLMTEQHNLAIQAGNLPFKKRKLQVNTKCRSAL